MAKKNRIRRAPEQDVVEDEALDAVKHEARKPRSAPLVATDPEYARRVGEFNELYVNETSKPQQFRVVAIRTGYYGERRRIPGKKGAEFVLTLQPGERFPSWVLVKEEFVKQQQAEAEREIETDGKTTTLDEAL